MKIKEHKFELDTYQVTFTLPGNKKKTKTLTDKLTRGLLSDEVCVDIGAKNLLSFYLENNKVYKCDDKIRIPREQVKCISEIKLIDTKEIICIEVESFFDRKFIKLTEEGYELL